MVIEKRRERDPDAYRSLYLSEAIYYLSLSRPRSFRFFSSYVSPSDCFPPVRPHRARPRRRILRKPQNKVALHLNNVKQKEHINGRIPASRAHFERILRVRSCNSSATPTAAFRFACVAGFTARLVVPKVSSAPIGQLI